MGNEAAEKTEEATSRRRSKERERGNVAKSKDMESAMVMIGGIALLGIFWKHIYNNIQSMMHHTFTNLNPNSIDTSSIVGILYPYLVSNNRENEIISVNKPKSGENILWRKRLKI